MFCARSIFFLFRKSKQTNRIHSLNNILLWQKARIFFLHQTSLQFNQYSLSFYWEMTRISQFFHRKKLTVKLKKVENKKKENNSKKNLKRYIQKMSCFYYYVNSLRKTRILFPSYHAWYRVFPIHYFFVKIFDSFFLSLQSILLFLALIFLWIFLFRHNF